MSAADFHATYGAHNQAVHRFLYRLTGNAADADDLVQETFVAFWRKGSQYRGDGSALAYLRRIAFRLYLNQRTRRLRREALAPAPEARSTGASDELERDEAIRFLIVRVREVLDTLPAEARDAFLMFRFEAMSCAEIADAMDAPLKTIESRIRRATRLLAERLRRYEEHLPQG